MKITKTRYYLEEQVSFELSNLAGLSITIPGAAAICFKNLDEKVFINTYLNFFY